MQAMTVMEVEGGVVVQKYDVSALCCSMAMQMFLLHCAVLVLGSPPTAGGC